MNMFSIAGVQFDVSANQSNVPEMERQLGSVVARFPWVQMVVFSELAAFGPDPRHAAAEREVEASFRQMAARHGIWLIPGSYYAKTESGVRNRSIVIDPAGNVIGCYDKQFPFLPYERGVEAGTEFLLFDVPEVGRFGLSICYDMWFPETSRTLVSMGAEVILHPSLTNTIDRSIELDIVRATAAMNQCYVVDVNGVGDGGMGSSIVAGPAGDTLYQAGVSAEVFPLPIDLDRVRWEREHGILGLGQVLKSFRDRKVAFPVYAQSSDEPSYLDSLGALEFPQKKGFSKEP